METLVPLGAKLSFTAELARTGVPNLGNSTTWEFQFPEFHSHNGWLGNSGSLSPRVLKLPRLGAPELQDYLFLSYLVPVSIHLSFM